MQLFQFMGIFITSCNLLCIAPKEEALSGSSGGSNYDPIYIGCSTQPITFMHEVE